MQNGMLNVLIKFYKVPLQNRFGSFFRSLGRKKALIFTVAQLIENKGVMEDVGCLRKSDDEFGGTKHIVSLQVKSVLGANRVCFDLK